MKRNFILNPYSGKGISSQFLTEMEKYFKETTGSFDYFITKSREDTINTVQNLITKEACQIVAVGGDGTINSVVNGFFKRDLTLVNKEASLAISKGGTGHDYYKSIMSKNRIIDWKETVLNHEIKEVDLGIIKYSNKEFHSQYFTNMASTAMIADIVQRKNKAPRWIPSTLRYITPTLTSVMTYKPKLVKIKLDNEAFEDRVLTISVSKGIYAGGGMKFGPKTALDDGLFEITLFEPMPLHIMITKLGKIYTGSYENLKGIRKYRSSSISISSNEPIPIEFDGETFGTTNVEMKVIPKALKVCFPK